MPNQSSELRFTGDQVGPNAVRKPMGGG